MKIITKIAMFRWGVEKFTAEVNKALAEGYILKDFKIEKKGFRFVCYAILEG